MSSAVIEILERLDQRYPTPDELASVSSAKAALPARVAAAREIASADRKAPLAPGRQFFVRLDLSR